MIPFQGMARLICSVAAAGANPTHSLSGAERILLSVRGFGLNLRLLISACCLATLGFLQAGCAVSPTTTQTDLQPSMVTLGDRPQMLFAGATRPEVKSLAMGAARSRAWNIVESTDDRLVAQRPLEPGSIAAQSLPSSDVPPGTLLEMTSYFVEDRGGVKVALEATVVSRAPGAERPLRTDATENFRPALMESLESLHSSWSRNRARVARAAPPLGAALADNEADEDSAAAPSDVPDRQPSQWTNEAAASVIAPSESISGPTAQPVPATAASIPPRPSPRAMGQPLPPVQAGIVAPPAPRAAEPRRPPGSPAPVIDASPIFSGRMPPVAATQPMSLPEPMSSSNRCRCPDRHRSRFRSARI
jgi:hypothetical protein